LSTILISEIFGPTIQGEGSLIGVPTVFVRTAGCDFLCEWCDTLYAVETRYRDTWFRMSAASVLDKVRELSGDVPLLVTLSGGNPALQPLTELIDAGHALGYTFALETQGSVAQAWFEKLDVLTISPKPPSSGMAFAANKLSACLAGAGDSTQVTLKIVVNDEADLDWAAQRRDEYPDVAMVVQPCNTTTGESVVDASALDVKMRWLIDAVNSRRWYDVRVLPQLHVQLWGNLRGV
jgi:7-carboxy-7-deazaguanine synthase